MEPVNPYQAPPLDAPNAAPDKGSGPFIENGRNVRAGHGWDWIAGGWTLFTQDPAIWIVNFVIMVILYMILGIVLPIIGTTLLSPIISAGFMLGAAAQSRGEPLEVNHLFGGLQRDAGALMVVGLIDLAFNVLILMVLGVAALVLIGGTGLWSAIQHNDINYLWTILATLTLSALLLFLLALLLYVPLMMAMWFAPALVVLNNRKPWDAMKMSFNACLKNIWPFTIYSLALLVLSVVALIPLGLGFLILVPVGIASTYAAYQDIFIES